ATGVVVSDTFPAGITSDTWVGSDGGSGTGSARGSEARLAPGGNVTYTVTATVSPSATGTRYSTVTGNAEDYTNTGNNSATDTDTLVPQNDISVTKVDNKGGSSVTGSVGTVVPGTSFTYTIIVSNAGPSTATNETVSDSFPVGITSDSWIGSDGSS